ncbi:Uncharacterized conserved protein, DUF2141 family [Sphingomonas laterariae]|uniref:Uncharacterized conserved protein, DUF2141 family n=1 Tax=Edaphosphingomonas laterariae TaxID=861865 RepID=A0A239HWY5_9SPHN|nr:DUF2141 domain-containing protein [Sphingomonas laterariae]SNS85223.1 Uncharacterized conserved protein, DUF2141 family [Sphingomonas laterariae]
MTTRLDLGISGLRSVEGNILVCLTQNPKYFPDCSGDPARRTLTIAAARATGAHIPDLAPGQYALSLVHDENGNGKLDTRLGIPREGFGFSRNPPIRFGAPSFSAVQFLVSGAEMRQPIRVRYLF